MTVARLCGHPLDGDTREQLRRAIDERTRELVDTSDCGDTASFFRYRKCGCRCASCHAVVRTYKQRWRDSHRELNAAHRRAYKQRRRLSQAGLTPEATQAPKGALT